MKKIFALIIALTAVLLMLTSCNIQDILGSMGHTHTPEAILAVPPTCTEEGSTAGEKCSECGEITVAPTTVAAAGHKWNSGEVTKEPGCEAEGTKTFDCTACPETKTETISAAGHKWNSGEVTSEPGCEAEGTKTFACTACPETKTETISAVGHSYSDEWTTDKEATCTETGSSSRHCSACGDKTDITEIPMTAHTWDTGVTSKAPTCTEGGEKLFTCTACSAERTEHTAAKGHTPAAEWTTEIYPTCSSVGSKSLYCTDCSTLIETAVIPKEAHTWNGDNCLICSAPKPSEGLAFTINSDGLSYIVTGIGTCTDTDLVIPDTYEGLPVTAVKASAFENCTSLVSVLIPDSVTKIGEKSFKGCTSLETIELPFVGETYSASDFRYFGHIFGTFTYGPTTNVPASLKTVILTYGTGIPFRAFQGCSNITTIVIPRTVTAIGDYAFAQCSSLSAVNIPASVESIGESAFSKCSSLPDIHLPSGLKTIGVSAFSGCSSLTAISIPDGIVSIGSSAFKDCTGIKNIEIPAGISEMGRSMLSGCTSLEVLTIPFTWKEYDNGVSTHLGYHFGASYYGDNSKKVPATLKTVIITAGSKIGANAFNGCSGITTVVIPLSIKSFDTNAFKNCTGLTNINYGGSTAQWNAISKGSDWNTNAGDYVIYCTDGEIHKGE